MADTWGHRQAQEYMGDRVDQVKAALGQVERRLGKTWRLGGQDGGGTCRGVRRTGGGIVKFASRRSKVVKVPSPYDAPIK